MSQHDSVGSTSRDALVDNVNLVTGSSGEEQEIMIEHGTLEVSYQENATQMTENTGLRPVFSILDAQGKNRVPSCFSNFGRSSDNGTAQEDAPAAVSAIQPEVQEDEDGEWESICLGTGVKCDEMTASASTIQPYGDAEPRGRSKYKEKS